MIVLVIFTGSLEGLIRGLSGTAILEDDVYPGETGDGDDYQGSHGEVQVLEHGMKQGGKVMFDYLAERENSTRLCVAASCGRWRVATCDVMPIAETRRVCKVIHVY